MARQRTNRLPFHMQLPSHYDIFVFEMDAYGTILNIQSIPVASPSGLFALSLTSDSVVVPDVGNGSDHDNVSLDRDIENICDVKIGTDPNSIVSIASKALGNIWNNTNNVEMVLTDTITLGDANTNVANTEVLIL